jgi:FkbM family methyltransferase
MKNFIFKLIVKILSKFKKTNSKDFLESLEYLILIVNGKHRGGYSLEDEVKQIHQIFKGKKIDNIIDCGANEGLYTDLLISFFPKANYFLFEPNKKLFSTLSKKYSDFNNIKIFEYALSNESAEVDFFETEYHGLSSLYKRKHESRNKKILEFRSTTKVKTRKFESLNITEPIDFLKIDVEGAELNVLKGFENKIRNVSVIQFEFGRANLDSKDSFLDFYNFFRNNNFDLYRITPNKLKKINKYSYFEEMFIAMNFIAINRDKVKI